METTRQELEELLNVIVQEVDCLFHNYMDGLKSIGSMERVIEKEVMRLGDKSKEVLGVTYEESLEVRIGILEACKESLAKAGLLFDQLFNNLEWCLKKTIEKECLFGFVCFLLIARKNRQGFERLEKQAKRALGDLSIEEDTEDALFVEELEEILPIPYPNHMGKIMALQYFPNRFIKASIDVVRKRYFLPKVPVIFVSTDWRNDNNVKDEKEYTVEFLNRRDAEKEAGILIIEYINTLSPQAKSQRQVGEFLLNKLRTDEIDEYLKKTESGFRIDTGKLQKDSSKPLRTVERFLEGLTEFCQQKARAFV